MTTTWTFGYDPIQQLTSAVRRNSGGTVIRDERYGYDGAGNRIQVTEDGVARNAQVNNLNQLTSERGYGKTKFTGTLNEPATVTVNGQPAVVKSTDGGVPYTFEADVDLASGGNTVTVVATDGNGNVRTNQYSVPTTGVVQNYEYDLNGNTRFEKTAAGVVVREFQWDQENRLVKIIAGTKESQFSYDGESKRVRIRELDGGAETSNQTFVWCGIKPCQKRGSTGGTVVRSYLENGCEESSTDYFYTKDHLGSIREVVVSGGTTVASVEDFAPWGTRMQVTGSGARSDFGFTGHYNPTGSAFGLATYRAYASIIGGWISRDPIEEGDGPNIYSYVHANPIRYVDPSGQSALLCAYLGITCDDDNDDNNNDEECAGQALPCDPINNFNGLDTINQAEICGKMWEDQKAFCRSVINPTVQKICFKNAKRRWQICMRKPNNPRGRCLPPLMP